MHEILATAMVLGAPQICCFWVQNVKLGKIWPRRYDGLEKTKLEPKFEVSISKNKETGQQSGYQKIWKIALLKNGLNKNWWPYRVYISQKKVGVDVIIYY